MIFSSSALNRRVAAVVLLPALFIPFLQTRVTASLAGSGLPQDAVCSTPLVEEQASSPSRHLVFEENVGQTDSRVRFVVRGGSGTAFVLPDSLVLRTARVTEADATESDVAVAVTFQIDGASPRAVVAGEERLPGTANYFRGNDPSGWHTGVRTFGRVRASDVYPGIDAVYYGTGGGLEYDFVVAPFADASQIRLAISGAEEIHIGDDGSLILDTPAGVIRHRTPRLYQQTPDGRVPVGGRFRLLGGDRVGFEVGGYDPAAPLVIDPVIEFSTSLGGSLSDYGTDVAVDDAGASYAVGYSYSVDFPATAGVLSEYRGGTTDAFVTKLDPSGQVLLFSAYVGGSAYDAAEAVSFAPSGDVVIAGVTASADFPVVNALQPAPGGAVGASDGFVAVLDSRGSTLTYATFLGGSGPDSCRDIVSDGDGSIVVCGSTSSTDFPTLVPLFGHSGSQDAFVARIAPGGGAFMFSTYLGGSSFDAAECLSIDSSGNIVVAGDTDSGFESTPPILPFPIVGGGSPAFGGGTDGFATKLSGSGQLIHYSRPFGGRGDDFVYDSCADASGALYVVGSTSSADFPAGDPASSTFGLGASDGFVIKIAADGDSVPFSRFVGGTGRDALYGVSLQPNGRVVASGFTDSTNLQTLDPFQSDPGGSGDGLVVALSASTGAVETLSYLGGELPESLGSLRALRAGGVIALMNLGVAFVPGTGTAEFGPGGANDVRVMRLFVENGVAPPSAPAALTASPASPFRISLSWTDTSSVESAFAVERRNAPAAPWIQIALAPPDAVSFNDDTVSAMSSYSYRVVTVAGPDRSQPSNQADATTPASSGLPVAPAFLAAAAVSGPHVALGWSDSSADESGFEIERRLEPAGPWTPIGTSPANVAAFHDTSPAVPATLGYRVRAINGVGPSGWSNTAVVSTLGPPAAPPGAPLVEQDASYSRRVRISWTAASGVVSNYRIERRVGSDPTWRLILNESTSSTIAYDDKVARDITYHYRVISSNAAGLSSPTDEASVTVLPPNPPQNLVAESPLSSQVLLNWNAPNGFTNGYFVERRTGAVGPFERISGFRTARFYTDTSVAPDTSYTYRVRAVFGSVNDAGIASDPSNEATLSTPGPGPTGATIAVNTSTDGNFRDSVVTLREALLIADGSLPAASLTPQEQAALVGVPLVPGLDVVTFAIPGAGPHKVLLSSALPDVVDTIRVDASTQAGYAGTPLVELDGSAIAAPNITGLRLIAPRSVVIGLAVGGFTGNGIFAGASEVDVSRCHAGVGPSGATANANGGSGILVQGGVECFIDRCVASGNAVAGIEVAGPGTSDTKITGCKLGTNLAGTSAIANGTGLHAGADSGRVQVGGSTAAERCVISGNMSHGLTVMAGSGVTLSGSYVGVDASGGAALPNVGDGINVEGPSCKIERGNVISANGQAGVRYTSSTPIAGLNLIRGSNIGVAADGRTVLGNAGPGIAVVNQSVQLGTTLGQDANVIAGNGGGGVVLSGSPFRSVIHGNFIGTNAFGDALGQPGDGIRLDGSSRAEVGNGGPSGRNTIAFTGGAGIAIPAGTLNWLRWNVIFATGGLPIDLGPAGPTPNDAGDADTGGNDLQNAPVLSSAMLDGPATIVTGTIDSLPLVSVRIEFVERATGARASRPLAVVDVSTDASGHADFAVSFVATIEPGTRIAALASHRALSGSDADTSETSNAVPVQGVAYGSDTPGIFVGSSAAFFLKNASAPGGADVVFSYGPAPSPLTPLVGDWNGDGIDTGGLYDPATGAFFLRNTNAPGPADVVFTYGGGGLGLRPVVGDWNGDGIDTVGLYAPATGAFFLRNQNAPGAADLVFTYGAGGAGVLPVIGDWNADGIDTVGIYFVSSGAFLLRNANSAGAADLVFSFGAGGANIVPVTGDWNGDGTDSIGIYDTGGGVWFLKNSNGNGAADLVFGYGPPAVPVTGDWDGPGA